MSDVEGAVLEEGAADRDAYRSMVRVHDETIRALARVVVARERHEGVLRELATEEKDLGARRVELEAQLVIAAIDAERGRLEHE